MLCREKAGPEQIAEALTGYFAQLVPYRFTRHVGQECPTYI